MARGWGREGDFEADAEDGSERFRVPPSRPSPYVTPEGYARLKAEYEHLWSVRRPEVVRALAPLGVRSLVSHPPTLEELFLRHYQEELDVPEPEPEP